MKRVVGTRYRRRVIPSQKKQEGERVSIFDTLFFKHPLSLQIIVKSDS